MLTCEWCGKRFVRPSNMGPKPKYCSQAHKQRVFEMRRGEKAAVNVEYVRRLESELLLMYNEHHCCGNPELEKEVRARVQKE